METYDLEARQASRRSYLGGRFDPSQQFLDGALKWVGLFGVLTAAAPVTFVLGVPRFLWQLLPDEPVSRWPALLAFPLAGVVLLVLWRLRCSKAQKALWALAAIAFAALLAPLSPEVTRSLWNGLPAHFWHHAPLYLGAFALLAGAAHLAASWHPLAAGEDRDTRWHPAERIVAGMGVLLLVAFYVLPQRGEIPIVETIRGFGGSLEGLSARVEIGIWANRFIALAPILALVLSAVSVARARPVAPGILFGFFAAMFPALCVITGFKVAAAGSGLSFVVSLRNAVVLGVVVVIVAAAVEALLTQFLLEPPEEGGQASGRWRDRLLCALQAGAPESGALPPVAELPAEQARLWRAASPLLRWLTARRARELLAERAAYGDPAEPVRAYVLRRLSGAGPRDPLPVAPQAEPWQPPFWARGHALAVLAALVLALGIGSRVAIAPAWEKGALWALDPAGPATEALFAQQLPAYVVALSRVDLEKGGTPETWERLSRARRTMIEAARPFPRVAAALEAFADVAERPGYHPKRTARAILALDAEVRAAGLPYVVEPVVWTRREGGRRDPKRPWKRGDYSLVPRVALKVFRVVRVRRFTRGGERFSAAWVERVDRLNIGEGHLGRSRRDAPYALVLADEARDYASGLLPALEDPPRLGSHWNDVDEALRPALAELVRAGLRAALDVPRTGADGPSGDAARKPQTAGLRPAGATSTVESVSRFVALSTERHELEHEADGAAVVPSVLYRRMVAYTDGSIRRTARELRAYLAQMADASAIPTVTLAKMIHIAGQRHASGTKEWYAARVVVDRIAEAMEIRESEDRLVAVAALAAAEPERVPSLAARVYEELFGAAPARFELAEEREARPAEKPAQVVTARDR